MGGSLQKQASYDTGSRFWESLGWSFFKSKLYVLLEKFDVKVDDLCQKCETWVCTSYDNNQWRSELEDFANFIYFIFTFRTPWRPFWPELVSHSQLDEVEGSSSFRKWLQALDINVFGECFLHYVSWRFQAKFAWYPWGLSHGVAVGFHWFWHAQCQPWYVFKYCTKHFVKFIQWPIWKLKCMLFNWAKTFWLYHARNVSREGRKLCWICTLPALCWCNTMLRQRLGEWLCVLLMKQKFWISKHISFFLFALNYFSKLIQTPLSRLGPR